MAVRRLHPDQPASFALTAENLAWAEATIAKYPAGKQASAVIPILWRVQEQIGGWVTEPSLRVVADLLGMAYIRVYEIATFYTMFQLGPIGSKAHVQVCGTTPCMLRGSKDLIAVCKHRIAEDPFHLSDDGAFSWEEVECLGSCANAPMIEVGKDTYEDLTAAKLDELLDAFAAGRTPKPGSQTGRTASCPEGGPTTLTDAALYDGSRIGAWTKRLHLVASNDAPVSAASTPQPAPAPATAALAQPAAQPFVHPAALAAMANAGLVKDLEARGSKPMSSDELARMRDMNRFNGPLGYGAATAEPAPAKPALLSAPRGGKGDDLGLIWGVADKLAARMNELGVWHFDQIAAWAPAEVAWFENEMPGFKGRIVRDKWIEQCVKLASGWRPDGSVGERPKE